MRAHMCSNLSKYVDFHDSFNYFGGICCYDPFSWQFAIKHRPSSHIIFQLLCIFNIRLQNYPKTFTLVYSLTFTNKIADFLSCRLFVSFFFIFRLSLFPIKQVFFDETWRQNRMGLFVLSMGATYRRKMNTYILNSFAVLLPIFQPTLQDGHSCNAMTIY